MDIEILHLVLFVAIKIMCLGFKIKTDIVFATILIAKLGISKKETGKASVVRKYLLICLSSANQLVLQDQLVQTK